MWNRNEGDILEQIIESALNSGIDALMVADDDSDDKSWDIINSFGNRIDYAVQRNAHIGTTSYSKNRWARQHLLDEVRRRHKPENTWVQIIESDIMVLDTDIRAAIKRYQVNDLAVYWQLLNCCRRVWNKEWDTWPDWKGRTIQEVMPDCHWMEYMLYTFRPVKSLYYEDVRKPWPRGLADLGVRPKRKKRETSPLLAHYGLRGPTQHSAKLQSRSYPSSKNPTWDWRTPRSVRRTIPFFSGHYNNNENVFPTGREGWTKWLQGVRLESQT